jgi:flavin-dependent dehydrogenase
MLNGWSSMYDFDVVVLGGGPAGSAAAIHCARNGLAVALLEREAVPRARPGETLHPGIEPILRQLGVWNDVLAANFLRHNGHFVTWGGPKVFVPFGPDRSAAWEGFQAVREVFDSILLERARKAGVTIYQPCRALRPSLKDGRVCGAETSEGLLRCKFLVDASGGRHWLATHLGLKIETCTPRLLVRYGYSKNCGGDSHVLPELVAARAGWTWRARVRPDVVHKSRLLYEDNHATSSSFSEPGHVPELRRGADVTWRVVDEPAGEGYFLAGDAAAVLDPLSSHGVLKALMSGIMVGHLICGVEGRRISEADGSATYSRWVSDWFRLDAYKLSEFLARLDEPPSWLPDTFERLAALKSEMSRFD